MSKSLACKVCQILEIAEIQTKSYLDWPFILGRMFKALTKSELAAHENKTEIEKCKIIFDTAFYLQYCTFGQIREG